MKISKSGLLALLLSLSATMGMAQGSVQPVTVSGSIELPCVTPAFTYSSILGANTLQSGLCGWRYEFGNLTGYSSFSLMLDASTPKADVDVYFYDQSGHNSWQQGLESSCSNINGSLLSNSNMKPYRVVVVLNPSTCSNIHDVSFKFTYSA